MPSLPRIDRSAILPSRSEETMFADDDYDYDYLIVLLEQVETSFDDEPSDDSDDGAAGLGQ